MKKKPLKLSGVITAFLFKKTRLAGIILLILLVGSIFATYSLTVNTNQLSLLPESLKSVKATNDIVKMLGGVGNLTIAFKGENIVHMKAVAEDIVPLIKKLDGVQDVNYKQDLSFITRHIVYYIKTEDFREAYDRVRKKIRSMIRKQSPMGFSLSDEVKDEPLDFSDIEKKYNTQDSNALDDPYKVDSKKKMMLLEVKPKGNPGDIAFTEALITRIDKLIEDYNKKNRYKAVLKEHYRTAAPGATITYGYTGDYKNNVDDSRMVEKALGPVSIASFLGILVFLLFFLRNIPQIIMLMATLIASILMMYGFTKVATGELNVITSILGAVIMGFGIDFGIYFIYRLKEEYTSGKNLENSIQQTLEHAGAASFKSAIISSLSFYILMISGFKGFSQFGLIAGTGVIISASMMYFALPVLIIYTDRFFPAVKKGFIIKKESRIRDKKGVKYPFAIPIFAGSIALTVLLSFFAVKIGFDYDGRSFMTADSPSLILQEEIADKFKVLSDPAAIYVPTLAEAKKIYEKFEINKKKDSTIDKVLSIHTLLPDRKQQEENYKILQDINMRLKDLPLSMLSESEKAALDGVRANLNEKPFGIEHIPDSLKNQFRPVKGSGYDGWLTYIYPGVSVWDAKELMRFADEIRSVKIGDKEYFAAGLPVLYADLAIMVLKDGKLFTIVASILIFILLLLYYRKIGAVIFAMLPLVFGLTWMLGLMYLTGWKLNFVNIVVFPVVLGYGVSSGVYIYERYRETRSVIIAVKHTGIALLGSSVTTLIGWGSLVISGHPGLASMGMLAMLGISASVVIAFTLMPSILQIETGFRRLGMDDPDKKSGKKK